MSVSYLNTTLEEGEIRAARYDGFGSNIWLMSSARWKQICGGNADEGSSIFNLLFGLKNERGALPQGLWINYDKLEKK